MCNVNNFVNGLKVGNSVIFNLTPHAVNIVAEDLSPLATINPEEESARCSQTTIITGSIGNIPITSTSFGCVEGLPEEQEDIYYIVSRLVMQGCPNRRDLLVPNDIVRDDTGRIVGCKSLANN